MTLSAAQYSASARMGARIGVFTGGGLVTQATNRTTGVTLNGLSGQITTNNASLAAEATAVFTVTNNAVFADDVVLVTIAGGSNGGGTIAFVQSVAAGSFVLAIQNNNVAAGTAETGAIQVNFIVMKASQTS